MLTNYNIGHDIFVQIWGAVWIGGRLNLVFLKDSLNKRSFKTDHYIDEVLKKEVKPYIKRCKNYHFILPLFFNI